MKSLLSIALLLVACVAPAFAKNSQTLHISQDCFVGDVSIPKGEYKLSWDGTGPTVEITMTMDNKQILKANARVMDQKHDSVVTQVSNQSGHPILQTIELKTMTMIVGMPIK
jgi:YD repeat-containing protein